MDTILPESSDRLRQALDDEIKSWQESTRALRSRRNTLAPISRLSSETLAGIFSYFPSCPWFKVCGYYSPFKERHSPPKDLGHLGWIVVTHVCCRWRAIALENPGLWSRIDFTRITPACMAEILTRAKMTPLHLEANIGVGSNKWSVAKFDAFERQLEAHISHTRHLNISGPHQSTLERLVSPAPTLEFLSLSHNSGPSGQVVIPINLFNSAAPSLTNVKLYGCDISWKSPLLKRLQTLEILEPPMAARPKLEDWLDALNEMSQLTTLILESATPLASLAISEPSRTITLPSLTRFDISASAKDCVVAFTHLILPALTWLRVDAESHELEGEDVQPLIPYISRNVQWLQSAEPFQSIMISGKLTRAEVFAWNVPNADSYLGFNMRSYGLIPARLKFGAKCSNWHERVNTAILDSLLTLLPIDHSAVSTFTANSRTGLSKEFWLAHASRWPLLERAHLAPPTVKGFREMLAEDTPPDGPRLPSLTKLIIDEVTLTAPRTFDLRDMLNKRVEQGVPLEVLDLRLCFGCERAIQVLREVVEVSAPDDKQTITKGDLELFNMNGGIRVGYFKEVEYYDKHPWYSDRWGECMDEYYDDGDVDYCYDDY